MKTRINNSWTKAEDLACRKLAATGLTTREIALQIPGRTRNAVIGHCHRENISVGAYKTPNKIPKARPEELVKRIKKLRAKAPAPKVLQPIKLKVLVNPDPPREGLLRLDEIHARGCRWPVSRDAEGEWLLCSAPRGAGDLAYCTQHRADSRPKEVARAQRRG